MGRRTKGFYEGKKLFETYMGWGRASSHNKLRAWCVANGMVNPQTGRVSRMGAFFAMWRYAARNPEEAYPLWKEHELQYDESFESDEEYPSWENFLKKIVSLSNSSIISPTALAAFKQKYNLNGSGVK